MPTKSEPLAIAGVNPKTMECEIIGQRHPDDAMAALSLGLIVVPVTAEKARWALGEVIGDLAELSSTEREP